MQDGEAGLFSEFGYWVELTKTRNGIYYLVCKFEENGGGKLLSTNYSFNTKEDLEILIKNGAVENQQLEFKKYSFIDGKVGSKEKDDLLKEITALANAEGGYIIIGIDEDGKRMASKLQHVGCSMTDFDGVQLAVQQYMLAKVRPRLYGVSMNAVLIESDKIAIVINVHKSFSRPHAVNDGNKDNFYIRHSNGVTYMSVDDLRKQFLFSASYKAEIKQFREERIGMVLAKECIGNLADGAMVLMHIIPNWSLDSGNTIDIKRLKQEEFSVNCIPISGNGWDDRYNSDGFCMTSTDWKSKTINSYSQIFRNGIIESVDIRMLNFNQNFDKQVYDWEKTEYSIYNAIKRYTDLLLLLNIPKPWYIYISLLNAKGFRSDSFYRGLTESIDRDIIHATECILTDDEPSFDLAAKATFDSLANAFGMPQSPNYNKDGRYVIHK